VGGNVSSSGKGNWRLVLFNPEAIRGTRLALQEVSTPSLENGTFKKGLRLAREVTRRSEEGKR
jgi:hypothetical protein